MLVTLIFPKIVITKACVTILCKPTCGDTEHSKNIKKAVVILISKTKAIEKRLDNIKTHVANNDNNETAQKLVKLQKQQINDVRDIRFLKDRIQELQNNIRLCVNQKKKIKDTHPIVIKNNESEAVDTQYNAIIKDFVGEDLK